MPACSMTMNGKPVLTIAAFTCLEALRNRLSWLLLCILILGLLVAEFAGGLSITEGVQTKSAVLGSYLRFTSVVLLGLFVITSQVREFQDKVIELTFSLAIPRSHYLLGKWLGYGVLGLICAALSGLLLLLYAPLDQTVIWAASLACELLIVVALSLLCSITFTQVTAAFVATAAVYILARGIGAIQLIAHGPIVDDSALSNQLITRFLDGIAFVLPDLYRFTRSDWLVYGSASIAELGTVGLQTAVYCTLLTGAALFDLYRKNL